MRRSATAHRENRYAHPTWRRGEHRIGELRTAAARGGALASPPHRHLFPLPSDSDEFHELSLAGPRAPLSHVFSAGGVDLEGDGRAAARPQSIWPWLRRQLLCRPCFS